MHLSCRFLMALSFLAATGASAFAVNLDPGGNVAASRLDPNDPSLTGATQAVLNSNFLAAPLFGVPSPDYQGAILSQVIKRSDDGGLDFYYQFTSTGPVRLLWQGFTISRFDGLAVDVLYLASAGNDRQIIATRSGDGSSIGVITGFGIDIPLVFRTSASAYDSGLSVNLQLTDYAGHEGGQGAPPFPFSATASIIEPIAGSVPEPASIVILGLASVVLVGKRRLKSRFLYI